MDEQLLVDESSPILKKDRVGTGVPNLDLILEGGYRKNGLVMVVGPTGMEKNAFAFHFANEGVDKKEIVIYILADTTKEDLLKKSSAMGFDFVNKKNIVFIDCYTSTLGPAEEKRSENEVRLSGPSALNDLSLAVKDILSKNIGMDIRVVFHSLSTFILYNPADSIIKFLQVVGGRLKQSGATTMFLVEEGMHEKTVLASVEHLMDEKYIIHDSGNFSVEVPGVGFRIPLRLGSAGIEVA